jgi:hypothetical protein
MRVIAAVAAKLHFLIFTSVIGAIVPVAEIEHNESIHVAGKPNGIIEFGDAFRRSFEPIRIFHPAEKMDIDLPRRYVGNLLGSDKSNTRNSRAKQPLLSAQSTSPRYRDSIIWKHKIVGQVSYGNSKINVVSNILSGSISDVFHPPSKSVLQRRACKPVVTVSFPIGRNLNKSPLTCHGGGGGSLGGFNLLFASDPQFFSGAPQSPSKTSHRNGSEQTKKPVVPINQTKGADVFDVERAGEIEIAILLAIPVSYVFYAISELWPKRVFKRQKNAVKKQKPES